MASNERFMPVPPEAVWDALADAHGFGYWVVGSSEIRDVDDTWPAPGSRFHHTVGIRPLRVRDHTESLEARRPSLLRLRAKARPLATAQVTLTLTPQDGGTRVRMTESPDGLTSWLTLNPVVQLLTKGRNAESLMRLEELALRRAGTSAS
jgi:uncharacterized protein YndB with AHSA1/START domain